MLDCRQVRDRGTHFKMIDSMNSEYEAHPPPPNTTWEEMYTLSLQFKTFHDRLLFASTFLALRPPDLKPEKFYSKVLYLRVRWREDNPRKDKAISFCLEHAEVLSIREAAIRLGPPANSFVNPGKPGWFNICMLLEFQPLNWIHEQFFPCYINKLSVVPVVQDWKSVLQDRIERGEPY
ncbi:hypothetical protein NP233_g2874 [Leucocoprinus birnbaumii]|uniref:Uncharacterized protein n=1 Tax=Leucocoprinus birnbaumii TaxID=56174 RepID=A0AAD5YYR4_9AGAR|nr:hypothetical protein NP233_g2874 [Leucocoprinus birnbaumii]